MRHSFYGRIRWLLIWGILTGLCGCAPLAEVMPPPPGFMVHADLGGPYDKEIPAAKADQIKSASLLVNGMVPYVFMSVADHFEAKGDSEKSIHFFNRAVSEFQKRNNVWGEGTAFIRKISTLERFGHGPEALESARQLEARAEAKPKPFGAFVLYRYGRHYKETGDYSQALKCLADALQASQRYEGNPDLTALRRDVELEYAITLILSEYMQGVSDHLPGAAPDEAWRTKLRRNIAAALFHLERAKALNDELKGAQIARYYPEIISSRVNCDLQNYLGLAYGIDGQVALALSHLDKAHRASRQAGYLLGEADNVFFLNQVYWLNRNVSEGIQATVRLETIADRYGLPSYAIWAQMMRAGYFRESGDPARAAEVLSGGLNLLERYDAWLSSFFGFRGVKPFPRRAVLEALFDLHILKDDHREAFRTAERIKALPFAGLCALGTHAAVPSDAHSHDIHVKKAIHLYRNLISPVNAPAFFTEMVEAIRKTQRIIEDDLELQKKESRELFPLACLDPPDVRTLQKMMEPNTTLFSYYLGSRLTYVWIISQNGFHQATLGISRANVERLVRDYHQALLSRERARVDHLSEQAYDWLLKPVIPFVRGDQMGIIPHGPLYFFPFASMRYMKAYLTEGFSISYLPHAGMMAGLPTHVATRGVTQWLILTDKKTADLSSVTPKTGHSFLLNATRDDVLKLTGQYVGVFFDLPWRLSDKQPFSSGFSTALSHTDTGLLNAVDLLRLSFTGRMSILRPCTADDSQMLNGEGLATLAGSLMASATPHVLMPLWEPEEKSKTTFVRYLGKHLEKNDNMAEAIRATQNEMIKSGAGPLDWAACILFGSP